MAKLDTTHIQAFMQRVRLASSGRAKDVRMSVEDATALSASIGDVLARLAEVQGQDTSSGAVHLDGGSFKKS